MADEEGKGGGAGGENAGGSSGERRKFNVHALNASGVTPAVVLGHAMEEAHDLEDIYIVSFRKDGTPVMWTAGNMESMGLAILCMQDLTFKFLNGMVGEEFDL